MGSGQLIIQEGVEVREEDVIRRWMEMIPRRPNKYLRKQPAVKGKRKRRPAGHKCRHKCMINKEATIKELEVECKLHNAKNYDQSREVRKQDRQEVPILKIGMSSFGLASYWRAPDLDVCYVCGEDDNHFEQECPYNYIYGLYDEDSCRARCLPGQHAITSIARRKFLECFVRVNNMPPSFRQWDLGRLFKPFGPLLMYDVPMASSEVCRGFGVVIFKKREDGERAINELNGYNAGDHKLRVDWAYPCA